METTSESSALAKLKQKTKGAHKRIKDDEAQASGRTLPPGAKSVVARAYDIGIKTTDKGDPNIHIKATVVEDSEGTGETSLAGIYCGMNHWFGKNDYQTPEQAQKRFYSDLKLMGFNEEVEQSEDVAEVFSKVQKVLKKGKTYFTFDVSTQPTKKGTYNNFVRGYPGNGYVPPQRRDKKEDQKAEKEGYDKEGDGSDVLLPFGEGDRVSAKFDGEDFEGTVSSLDEGNETAEVEFDDGEIHNMDWSDLTAIE